MAENSVRSDQSGGVAASHLLALPIDRRKLGKRMAIAAAAAGIGGQLPGAVAAGTVLRAFAQDAPPTGGSIIVARAGDSDSLDPAHTTASISFQVFNNIYDTLVAYNMELTYEGILAESWEVSADGLTYTFKLRQGITFHDGTEFNAEAVKFNYDRLMDPVTNAPAAGWITPLAATNVIDPYTVALVLSTPFSPLLGNLCLSYFGISSPTAIQASGEEHDRNPVGTGPWKFQEWIAGEQITLVRNEAYHNFHSYMDNKGAPYIDELIFRNIPEVETQIAAFETGEVNLLPTLPPREVERFQDEGYTVVVPETGTNITFIEFSMEEIPTGEFGAVYKPGFFEDVRVRQAVAYAINADEIVESVWEGFAVRNYGPMPNGMFAYKPEIEEFGYHFDPEKAKALLDEAGWVAGGDGVREKDGKKLEPLMWGYTATNIDRTIQVIQNQLAQVGFGVKIEMLEVATMLARLVENVSDFDLMGWGWPEPHLLKMMVEAQAGLGRYKDEQYHSLVDQASATNDLTERTNLYFEASKKLLADAVALPLYTTLAPIGARPEVKEYEPGPRYSGAYEDAYIED